MMLYDDEMNKALKAAGKDWRQYTELRWEKFRAANFRNEQNADIYDHKGTLPKHCIQVIGNDDLGH